MKDLEALLPPVSCSEKHCPADSGVAAALVSPLTELSVDGGQTWTPAADSLHLEDIANRRPVIAGALPTAMA
jgi:hypothetical protein